eukprot:TRINITY_DN6785_c0_g1_i1.p1 TRINITY_DN6785_c0_g1~~TRINITY_DN6785_c0_g1_i1.p1  ORF type:complete len:467 (+),score=163.39 TRINITY_DN6785_c0_g1_i1:17-1417(+)
MVARTRKMSHSRMDYRYYERPPPPSPYQPMGHRRYNDNFHWHQMAGYEMNDGNPPSTSRTPPVPKGSRWKRPNRAKSHSPRVSERRRTTFGRYQKPQAGRVQISKESEDTLRNRIRNETQLQEERDKEHQDQVKDKVRELQKKLTAPESSSILDGVVDHEASSSSSSSQVETVPLPTTSTTFPVPRVEEEPSKGPPEQSKKSSSSSSSPKSLKRDKKKSLPKKFRRIEKPPIPVLNYESFKTSIVKKDPKYLKELIESPSFLKRVLMTKLVEEHRRHISDKLSQLRFEKADHDKEGTRNGSVSSNGSSSLSGLDAPGENDGSDPFCEVNFKELPDDFILEISNLIQCQKENQEKASNDPSSNSAPLPAVSDDEDIMEVPVPPKTPPPFVNLSDGEDLNDEPEKEKPHSVFAENLINEIEILNTEERDVLNRLQALSAEKNKLNGVLSNIAQTRNKLLLEAASLLKS